MAVTDFLFDKITIKSISTTLAAGEETITETVVYNDIYCKIYELNNTLKQTKESKQTSQSGLKCILDPNRTDVRDGMIALVSTPISYMGKYTIAGVRPVKTILGGVDHIEFSLNDKFLTR